MTILEANRNMEASTLAFLSALAASGEAGAVHCVQTFDDQKPARPGLTTAPKFAPMTKEYSRELAHLNDKGAGVFVLVNGSDGTGRKKENITHISAIWIDDDNYRATPRKLDSFPVPPSMIVRSSKSHEGNGSKFHYYWLIEKDGWPVTPDNIELFDGVMRCLIADHSHDKNAKDLSRVMRLPGFNHMKHGAVPVELVKCDGDIRYTMAQIAEAFPPLETKPMKAKTGRLPVLEDSISTDTPTPLDGVDTDALLFVYKNALKSVDAACKYSLWIGIAGDLFAMTGGREAGYKVFDSWSSTNADKYQGPGATLEQWRNASSFDFYNMLHVDLPMIEHSIPVLSLLEGGEGGPITQKTMADLSQTFEGFDHKPSSEMLTSIREIVQAIELMAMEELKPRFYLSSLAPGAGKTQALIHSLKNILVNDDCGDASAVIFLERIEEIDKITSDAKLNPDDFACLVSPSRLPEIGNVGGTETYTTDDGHEMISIPSCQKARVLFTTMAQLHKYSEAGTVSFGDIKAFQYDPQAFEDDKPLLPRTVRIRDEFLDPAKHFAIDKATISELQAALERNQPLATRMRQFVDAKWGALRDALWSSLPERIKPIGRSSAWRSYPAYEPAPNFISQTYQPPADQTISFLEWIRKFNREIEQVTEAAAKTLPSLDDFGGLEREDVLKMFAGWSQRKTMDIENFLACFGSTVRVRYDEQGGGFMRQALVHFSELLPSGLEPLLILDASGDLRQTYSSWERERAPGNLVKLPAAKKSFEGLTIHIAGDKDKEKTPTQSTGKGWFKKPENESKYTDILLHWAATIKPLIAAGDDVLVVHHKPDYDSKGELRPSSFPNITKDLQMFLNAELETAGVGKLEGLTWGRHTASNAFRDFKHVFVLTLFHQDKAVIEALMRGSGKLAPTVDVDPDELAAFERGEHAHNLNQAVCRVKVRLLEGSRCASDCHLWIRIGNQAGLVAHDILGRTFPGHQQTPWGGAANPTVEHVAKLIAEFYAETFEGRQQTWWETDTRGLWLCIKDDLLAGAHKRSAKQLKRKWTNPYFPLAFGAFGLQLEANGRKITITPKRKALPPL